MLNVSQNKGSQTMKSGQLIKYNMKNIFWKNHTQNVLLHNYFQRLF